MIKVKNAYYTYESEKEKNAIKDVNVVIPSGQVVVLCGESGSGKTTFGRLVNGLIPKYYEGTLTGDVFVHGKEIAGVQLYELAGIIGSVFQNPKSQFYTMMADTEIVFGCENIGMPKKEILDRFEKTVRLFHMEELLGKNLLELSGGEKQKIACASAEMPGPDILVLDEPTSNLDIHAIQELRTILKLWKSEGKTVLIAEHRLSWMKGIADRVLYFKNGKIEEDIAAEEFYKWPAERFHQRGLRCAGAFTPKKRNIYKAGNIYTFTDFTFSYKNGMRLDIQKFAIPKGTTIAILGDNGAGKSTLAKCICGIMKHCKGKIFDGENIYRGRKLSTLVYMVFQDVNHQLFAESVQEEVTLGLKIQEDEREKTVERVLRRMGLYAFKDSHPMALSGGQKQRLAVAEALATQKELIIYDEPTSGLDYGNMQNVADMINELSQEGKTQLIITHDPEFVESCCDGFIFLENGKIKYEGGWTEENIEIIRKYFRSNM